MKQRLLTKNFFKQDTLSVARKLLGCILITKIKGKICSGMIVEVEAYTSDDEASHSYGGEKIRNKSMFLKAGTLYVYRSYGIHACFNIVTEDAGRGAAVLIRGIEPLSGISIMKKRRGIENDINLTNGPGKLTEAMGITLSHNGASVFENGEIQIKNFKKIPHSMIITSTRIGITKAVHLPRRFLIKDNPWISRKYKPLEAHL